MALRDSKTTVKNECATCVLVLIGTALFSLMIYYLFDKLSNGPESANIYYGFGFGSSAGFLFMISFIIAGGLKNSFSIVLERWSDFIENLQISFGFAIKDYFTHIKDEGMVFWLYILVMIIQLLVASHSLSTLADLFL